MAWHVTQQKLPECGLESRTILFTFDLCDHPNTHNHSPWLRERTARRPQVTNTSSNLAHAATDRIPGNAKKAEVAAQKQAVENAKKAKEEDKEWAKGAKDNSKA